MTDVSRVASIFIGKTKGHATEALAKVICCLAGISITDDSDESPNWWMFAEQAAAVIDDLDARGLGCWKEGDAA